MGARLCCVLLSLGLGSSCSYAFVQAPAEDHQTQPYVECTESRLAPIADVLGALQSASLALFINSLSALSPRSERDEDRVVAASVVLLAAAGVQIASAVYGFSTTSECDRAQEQWQLRMIEPAPAAGCASDLDCKGDRICVDRVCTDPARGHRDGVRATGSNRGERL